jgi:hypothetical protein
MIWTWIFAIGSCWILLLLLMITLLTLSNPDDEID